MKINILTSNCKKGNCGPECPYCRMDEMFRSMGGDHQPEHGILQEAVENIIPPAFNRLVDYSKLGSPPIGEASFNMPGATAEEYTKAMSDWVNKNQMKSKAAQDVFAQYVVRYVRRSYEHRGRQIDHLFNAQSISRMFAEVHTRVSANSWYRSWYKHTKGKEHPNGNIAHPDLDSKPFRGREPLITEEELQDWLEHAERLVEFKNSFQDDSETSKQWVNRARSMPIDASSQEHLVLLGQQYKSYVKSMKKFYKRNPALLDTLPEHMEFVRRAWNYKQDKLVSHSMGNLRKIGKFLSEEKKVGELGALVKKHPDRRQTDPETGDITGMSSLYHANELIDNEILKGQLDACPDGWASADMGNAEDDEDMTAPCVLHEYDDGFIWWNRRASSCSIAGDEMANCGASNRDSSTLLILKEKINNDSMEVMDKLKGRIMVEYDPNEGEFVQILGFGNSFPEEKYWEKIKDLHDNLAVQEVSKWAFTHLRERGRTDQQTIDSFLSYLDGGKKFATPEEFFYNDNANSFMDRIKRRDYDLQTEAEFGGNQVIRFTANHRRSDRRYAPILVQFSLNPLMYVALPQQLSTDDHPSLETELIDLIARNDEDLRKKYFEKVKVLISRAMMNFEPAAGVLTDEIKRMFKSFRYISSRSLKSRASGGLQVRLRASFEITPEFFTNEDIGREDEPLVQLAHKAVMRIRATLGQDGLLRALNDTLRQMNQDYSDGAIGETYELLNLAEIIQELENIPNDVEMGIDIDSMTPRLENLYKSLMSPRGDDGYLNIDALAVPLRDAWSDFINDPLRDSSFFAAEWNRIDAESRTRQTAMQQGGMPAPEQAGDDDEVELPPSPNEASILPRQYFGHHNDDRVTRWADRDLSRGQAQRHLRRMINEFEEFGEDWDISNLQKAQINAIDEAYDIDSLGLDNVTIDQAEELIYRINSGDFGEIEENPAQPGDGLTYQAEIPDPTPAATRTLTDQLLTRANMLGRLAQRNPESWRSTHSQTNIWRSTRQQLIDAEMFVDWLQSLPEDNLIRQDELEDARREANMTDAQRNLVDRGNMMMRYLDRRAARLNNPAFRGTVQRLKQRMKENEIWDSWWATVPDSHPLKTSGVMDDDQRIVEARALVNKLFNKQSRNVRINIAENNRAHLNEDAEIRKGGVLPFKKEEGEFYFMLGKAPQGWWSDFRGGEEPEDNGDLMATAAREFTEESSFELPVSLDDAMRIEHKNAAIFLTDLAELDASQFDINKVMRITQGHYAGTPEIVEVAWFHIDDLPNISNTRMPVIQKAIASLMGPEPNATGMETAGGDAFTPFLNENEGIEVLHIFDFDDTIAFTTSYTQVTVPDGEITAAKILSQLDKEPPGPPYALDQHGLDQMFREIGPEEELESRGFDLDFSSFKAVAPSSPLNPVIARRINDCCLAGGRDPNGDFYVLTARSAAAEDSIHQYLSDNKIDIDRSKVIGVEGKSKGDRIKSILRGSGVKKVIFYDDSDNNIQDVARLRDDPDLQGVVFELYPVDKDGNIPKKPMQETIYERKRFKIRIGAK